MDPIILELRKVASKFTQIKFLLYLWTLLVIAKLTAKLYEIFKQMRKMQRAVIKPDTAKTTTTEKGTKEEE